MTELEQLLRRWREVRGTPGEAAWVAEVSDGGSASSELRVAELKAAIDAAIRTSPPTALEWSELLLAFRSLAPRARATIERGRAVALHANGRSGEALPHYLSAVEVYDRDGEELEAARVRRSLVDVLQMHGRADEALEVARIARIVFESRGERRLLAQLECNVGNVHFRRDSLDHALASYERAIALFEAVGDEYGRAFARYNVANILTNGHRFAEAERAFQECLAVFLAHGHMVLAADAAYGAAYLDFRRGRWTRAIQAFERARAAYVAGGKPTGEWLCELDLAELHIQLGAHRDAEHHAERAEAGFTALGMLYEASKARAFRGLALARRGERLAADVALTHAYEGFVRLGNPVRAALVTLHRATLRARGLEAADFLVQVQAAHVALEQSGDTLLARIGRLGLAEAQLAAGRNDDARRGVISVLEELGAIERGRGEGPLDAGLEVDARRTLARTSPDAPEAVAELRRAVAAIERTYAGLAFRDARLAFFAARQSVYTELAGLLLQQGDVVGAIQAVEQGRQRSAFEHPMGAALDDPELAEARAELDGWLSAWLDTRLPEDQSRARVRATSAPLLAPRQDELLRRARRALRHEPGRGRDDDGWRRALASGEACLYFLADGEAVHVVLQTGERTAVARASVTSAELRTLSERFRHQAEKVRLGRVYRERHAEQLERTSARLFDELGDTLLGGLGAALEDVRGRRLCIVPHGVLHDLPLHMARRGGIALHERARVFYARSLGQLAALRDAERPTQDGSVVVVSDDEAELPELPGEIEGLAAVHGARLERVALDGLAARASSRPIGALHLAAHGAFQPEHPLFSGLRFGRRFLTALDVERLDLRGALVTLSGCETGRQNVAASEDPFGPERSFLVAGARAVVGSLWPVDDAATAAFMTSFHVALGRTASPGQAYAEALAAPRAAGQLTLDRAAWVLVGSGE